MTSPDGGSVQQVRRAVARAERGQTLDADEAAALVHARGEELERLLAVASRLRDQGLAEAGRPGVVTYSRKVFVPVTRLCRDRCHYCTFATDPATLRREGSGLFLSPDEVVALAQRGAELGCTEALFTLGDRPEDRWPQARAWLDEQGYDDTLSYVRALAVRVLEETGLLPHLNPGVMTWQELRRLRPVAPSMGLMLETTAERLWSQPGAPHHGSPDKQPAVRLRVLEDAGRQSVPFTTGILVGIGETPRERVESLVAIRQAHRRHGHVQEVIVQNFRAKADTAMRDTDDLGDEEYLATLAAARVLLGPRMRLQAPPNLSDPEALHLLLRAGVDDWGGVSPLTPDHVNPERPWPTIERLSELTAAAGFTLRPRLTAHPEYVRRASAWIDPRLHPHVRALADPTGLAIEGVVPQGLPWQEPDDLAQQDVYADFAARNAGGRTDLHVTVDTEGRTTDRRGDFDEVYGDWAELRDRVAAPRTTARLDGDVRAALALAADDPAALADPRHESSALALMTCDGEALDVLARLADDVRRDTVGDDVTYVVNRNINFTNVCYTGCRFCAFAQRATDADAFTLSLEEIAQRTREAWDAGATEVCMQGGIHPDLPGTAYFDLARAVKAAAPGIHLHAFSPMEVVNGASRSGLSVREWLVAAREAGVDSVPGTAAEILDDDVRWVLTKGKLPADAWVDVVTTAHDVGLRSSSTMMYGHVDEPAHWTAHLRLLRDLQRRTGGFTEFVALPFVHHQAPVYLAGVARPGPTPRDNRAVHAMARLMLHGAVDHVQCSWVKLGTDGVRAMLAAGCDDLGGTLMEETISRMAGSEHGSRRSVAELEAMAAAAGRPARQRTTTYGPVDPERVAAARRAEALAVLPG
ncbi:MAG: bifunctional FO biosynthesis protein CofGH [Candidatus Nanopelagicales bacterium]